MMFFYEQEMMVAKLKQQEIEQKSRNAWRLFTNIPKQKEKLSPTTTSKDCCTVNYCGAN